MTQDDPRPRVQRRSRAEPPAHPTLKANVLMAAVVLLLLALAVSSAAFAK